MKFFVSKIIFVLFLSFISNGCFGQKLTETSKENTSNNAERISLENQNINQENFGITKLRFYFTPLTEPVSIFVMLDEKGEAQQIHYLRYRLLVTQIFKGNLSRSETTNLLKKIRDSSFRRELESAAFNEKIAEEGDLFSILIEPEGKKYSGILDKAPETVKNYFQTLLQVNKSLTKAQLSEAYLRVELIENERFERLKQSKRLRFIPIGDLSADIQSQVVNAISNSQDFFPLSQGQFDKLKTYASYGQELFVANDNLGYQLTLYQSQK